MNKKASQPKLSEWFPPEVKPQFVGWYEREYKAEWSGKLHDYWNGKRWFVGLGDGKKVPAEERKRWRGLSENPDTKGKQS